LQLLLDGIGDLGLHFGGGRDRPDRRDVDDLTVKKGSRRGELLIGGRPGDAERLQEQNQRGMADAQAERLKRFIAPSKSKIGTNVDSHCDEAKNPELTRGSWIASSLRPRNDGIGVPR